MSDAPPTTRDPVDPDWREDRLSVSDQCELLASPRRQAVLRYLMDHPEDPVSVDTLAGYVLAEDPNQDRQNVTFSLCHLHLPKLAEAGVINFDSAHRRVCYRPHSELEQHLTFLENL